MSVTRLPRTIVRAAAHTAIWLVLLVCGTPGAHATPYWTTLTGSNEIANGINGFSTPASGGAWSIYGNTCETKVSSYAAGGYCKFRFTPPAGTTALEGIARGQYSIANTNMVLRSERPGGAPSYVLDGTTKGAFNHGFGVLGPYFDIGFFAKAATTMSGAYNWMHIDTFEVKLDDPSAPQSLGVSFPGGSADGWHGPGCVGGSYGWADTGSQLWATSLTNLTTGQGVHGWTVAPGRSVVTSGVPSVTFSTCIPASATGVFTYRSAASDRAGNGANLDFALKFDVTPPQVSDPQFAGAPVTNGQVFGSVAGYRPAITWPGVIDLHSGISTMEAFANGSPVPVSFVGSNVTLAPTTNLPLGNVVITLRVSDQVGNQTSSTRTIVVADDRTPTMTVASPSASGGASPVLDVTAQDDASGIDPATWTVFVDGQVLVAASDRQRLQAEIGRLADGSHSIRISVADHAGNVATSVINYVADSGPGVPQLPDGFTTGIYVYEAPTSSRPAMTHRFRALMVKNGRPIDGRAEIREGADTVASKELEANGTVDMAITINKPRTVLTYHAPSGTGLQPTTMVVTCDQCVAVANAAVTGADTARDRAAPAWKLALVQQKSGVVRRSGRIAFRVWTSERSVVHVHPLGSDDRSASTGARVTRGIQIAVRPGSLLWKRVRTARPGAVLKIRIRIYATDASANRSVPRVVTFAVRV